MLHIDIYEYYKCKYCCLKNDVTFYKELRSRLVFKIDFILFYIRWIRQTFFSVRSASWIVTSVIGLKFWLSQL